MRKIFLAPIGPAFVLAAGGLARAQDHSAPPSDDSRQRLDANGNGQMTQAEAEGGAPASRPIA